MLLQRLVEYAERDLGRALPPAGYQSRPVRYIVDLDASGNPIGSIYGLDTANAKEPAARRGRHWLVPDTKRSGSKPVPILLADTAWRTYNLTPPGKADAWTAERHHDLAALVSACAEETGEPSVRAVANFLSRAPDLARGTPPDATFDLSGLVAFRIDDVMPTDLPSVRAFWARRQSAAAAKRGTAETMPCVVCGRVDEAVRVHPLKIKGIRAGQTGGTDLISANEDVYESYGLKKSLIAPTCGLCAEAYANALNALLANPETHLHLTDVEYVFWTAEPQEFSVVRLLSAETSAEVRALLNAAGDGAPGALALDASAFYALGLGASGARAVVRSWLDTTVGTVKRRLAQYFALQELVGPDGQPGPPLPLWRLARATVRDPRKDAPPPELADALLALALAGTPLPLGALAEAVRRCRANQGVGRAQAMLIKMALCSEMDAENGRIAAMSELDERNGDVAYRCGRLLAVLDAVQRRSLGTPNATLIDKYYGSASSAPAAVFGTLLAGAQHHLAKLRKDPRAQGAYVALDRRLQEVMLDIKTFPRTLSLPEQGMFALGYYHERAESRRAARERADAARDEPDSGGDGNAGNEGNEDNQE